MGFFAKAKKRLKESAARSAALRDAESKSFQDERLRQAKKFGKFKAREQFKKKKKSFRQPFLGVRQAGEAFNPSPLFMGDLKPIKRRGRKMKKRRKGKK